MTFRPTKLFKNALAVAERTYGKRSGTHRFIVEGRDYPIPETLPPDAAGNITICFANEARTDYDRLRFQLSHEAIHVICGGFKRQCLVFEEGLATHFSLTQSTSDYASRAEATLPRMFANALSAFRKLNPSPEKIRQIRATILIDHLTPTLLERYFGSSPELALVLCDRVSARDADRLNG